MSRIELQEIRMEFLRLRFRLKKIKLPYVSSQICLFEGQRLS